MTWPNFGWSGSGSGSGGGMVVHGTSYHDSTVPSMETLKKYAKLTDIPNVKMVPPQGLFETQEEKPLSEIFMKIAERLAALNIKPNLLYNSTGMVSMSGWLTKDKVTNYRDDYILDDYSYFVITGDNLQTGFICKSVPVEPHKTYTFSGEFFTHGKSITVVLNYQNRGQLNTTEGFTTKTVFTGLCEGDWTLKSYTFTCPSDTLGVCIGIYQAANDETTEVFIRHLKIEEGSEATKWIPSMTDPYQNIVAYSGFNASSFKK